MTTLDTQVLDTTLGQPASNVRITLFRTAWDGAVEPIGGGVTDAEGRVRDLVEPGVTLGPGEHRLRYEVADYFALHGRDAFFSVIDVAFVLGAEAHHHVPLLLSPFGYTVYRGA